MAIYLTDSKFGLTRMKTRVAATIASFPDRFGYLAQVVDRIQPQVDLLFVYLNNTARVPTFLRRDYIVVNIGDKAEGDLRDAGKFYPIDRLVSDFEVLLTLDDDIAYPPNYIKAMCAHLNRFDSHCAVGVHAALVSEPFVNAKQSRRVFHFREPLAAHIPVNLIGTGTMAIGTNELSELTLAQLQPGAVDVSFAGFAKRAGLPLVAVPRLRGWLSPMTLGGPANRTLYDEMISDSDSIQNLEFHAQRPWGRPAISHALAIHPRVVRQLGSGESPPQITGIRAQGLESETNPVAGDELVPIMLERILVARSASAARPWVQMASSAPIPSMGLDDWRRTAFLPGWSDEEILNLILPLLRSDGVAEAMDVLIQIALMRPTLGKSMFRQIILPANDLSCFLLEKWFRFVVPTYSKDKSIHYIEVAQALAAKGDLQALSGWLDAHIPDPASSEWMLLKAYANKDQLDTWMDQALIATGVEPLAFPLVGDWRLLQGIGISRKPVQFFDNWPKVSLGVIVRDSADTVEFAIQSLLNQRYPNLEIIVVDNSSTDSTPSKLAAFEAAGCIKVIRLRNNVGPYVGRNLVIQVAKGEFVGFHDGDDFAHPEKIVDQVEALLAQPSVQVVVSTHVRVGREGNLVLENHGQLLGHGPVTALFRASTFKRAGLYDATMTRGDIEFLGRVGAVYGEHAVLRLEALHLLAGISQKSNSNRWEMKELNSYRHAFRHRHKHIKKIGVVLAQPDVVPNALRAPQPHFDSGAD